MSDEEQPVMSPGRHSSQQTDLERKIFGDSSDDESPDAYIDDDGVFDDADGKDAEPNASDSEQDAADDNDMMADDTVDGEVRVQKTRRKRGKKPSVASKPAPSSAPSDRILEARREFDEALEKIKGTNSRRKAPFDIGQPVDLDDIAESFVRRMARAADNDYDAIEAGRPALEKQKMLAEVLETLMKRHLHEALLDNDLLGAVRRWLEPMPNRTLPAPNIRKALLEQLRGLPIETVHLRESGGLGRIVNFFSQRPGELDDLRRLSSELVSLWARPILQRASDKHADDEHTAGHSGKVLRSEALRTGTARRYSGGSVETRQQRRIAQSLSKKKARPSTKF